MAGAASARPQPWGVGGRAVAVHISHQYPEATQGGPTGFFRRTYLPAGSLGLGESRSVDKCLGKRGDPSH